jgi:hypothetical protein
MGPFASDPQTYDVAAGQKLVIESMSAIARVPTGQSANLWLDIADQKTGDVIATYYIPTQFQATYSAKPNRPGHARLRLAVYESRGLKVNDDGSAGVVITGHLEG